MTDSSRIVLELIRKGGDVDHLVDASCFADVDWDNVMDFAMAQGVLGLCYDAIEMIISSSPLRGEGINLGMEDLMEWVGQVAVVENDYDRHLDVINSLARFYHDNGIKMMLLKGYGLSLYWPKPNHRPVGDVDIYLRPSKSPVKGDLPIWKLADLKICEQLGIVVNDGHEHHTTFNFQGIAVENHYDFINTKAHRDAPKIEDKLKQLAFRDVKNVEIGVGKKCEICLPSADFNVIFLIRHLGQHFAGEHVTLRQLLDWGLFLQHDGDKVNWDEVIPFLKDMGIWTFFTHINAICVDVLGIEGIDKYEWFDRAIIDEHLRNRILEDILNPEFNEDKPEALLPVIWFKMKRWWYNRWKHPLVYREWLLPMFLTLMWSHVRRIKTIKDG